MCILNIAAGNFASQNSCSSVVNLKKRQSKVSPPTPILAIFESQLNDSINIHGSSPAQTHLQLNQFSEHLDIVA
jgi:hypothetical protein